MSLLMTFGLGLVTVIIEDLDHRRRVVAVDRRGAAGDQHGIARRHCRDLIVHIAQHAAVARRRRPQQRRVARRIAVLLRLVEQVLVVGEIICLLARQVGVFAQPSTARSAA
jgi:hypothetical protein